MTDEETTKFEGLPSGVRVTPAQEAILRFIRDTKLENAQRHLIIQAYAGTGKSTLLQWAAQMLTAIDPGEVIMAVMFNKHNKVELQKKLPGGTTVLTTHGLGYAAIRKYLGGKNPEMDDDKYSDIALHVLGERALGIGPRAHARDEPAGVALRELEPGEFKDAARTLAKLATMARLTMTVRWTSKGPRADDDDLLDMALLYGLDTDMSEVLFPLVERVVQEGLEVAQTQGVIDYADMLFWPVYDKKVGWCVRHSRWVLGDEVQDWNRAQQELVKLAVGKYGKFVGVGDYWQAIMMFAGAASDGMNDLGRMFIGEPVVVRDPETGEQRVNEGAGRTGGIFSLPDCWRSGDAMLAMARELVPGIKSGLPDKPATIETDVSEDDFVRRVKVGDLAVSRRVAPLARLALKLMMEGKPVVVRGKGDPGLLAVVKKIERRRGGKDVANFLGLLDAWEQAETKRIKAKATGSKKREALAEQQVGALADRCMALRFIYDITQPATLDALKAKIQQLFPEQKGDGDNGATKGRSDVVELATVHRSKGDEREAVWVIAPQLLGPGKWDKTEEAIQQANNVKYVALTRAKSFMGLVQTAD